jgi:hypothetical protein
MNVYFVRTNGLDEIAILNGFRWLIRQCANKEKVGIVATPQQQSLANVLRNLKISNMNIKGFFQDKCIRIDEAAIQLLNSKMEIPYGHEGIILAVYPNKQLLATIDKMTNIASILVIPRIMSECQEWLTNKNACEIR